MGQHIIGNELFVAARNARGWHSQEDIAEEYDRQARAMGERASISVRQVRRWESARPPLPNRDARRVLRQMFGVPLEELGFVRPGAHAADEAGSGVRRRTFLGAVAAAAPVLTMDDLNRLCAALTDAHRYADDVVVTYLCSALDASAQADGDHGPRETLPVVLGLIATVDRTARDARSDVRRDLLRVGARAAEFAAWLYRDAGGAPDAVTYWQDRAMEWATMAGDSGMQAYVLLRKAQSCPEDGARMLDLATAVVEGPWRPTVRVKAEAVQQQARGMALTGEQPDRFAPKLDEAYSLLSSAGPARAATVTGPLGAGYSVDLLMLQTAIGYREAQQPAASVKLFRRHMEGGDFSTRDRAFLASHMATALADAGEPDEAASTALDALPVALATRSGRTLAELANTARALHPYRARPLVSGLCEALSVPN